MPVKSSTLELHQYYPYIIFIKDFLHFKVLFHLHQPAIKVITLELGSLQATVFTILMVDVFYFIWVCHCHHGLAWVKLRSLYASFSSGSLIYDLRRTFPRLFWPLSVRTSSSSLCPTIPSLIEAGRHFHQAWIQFAPTLFDVGPPHIANE